MASHANSTAAPAADPRSRVERYLQRHLDRAGELIATLDDLDGDTDLEPSLAFTDQSCTSTDDREDESDFEPSLGGVSGPNGTMDHAVDLEEDTSDDEPNVAAPEGAQEFFYQRCGRSDESEPDGDLELSLGWPESARLTGSYSMGTDELEDIGDAEPDPYSDVHEAGEDAVVLAFLNDAPGQRVRHIARQQSERRR